MGEKKVDRFLFKLSDKIGEGSYGQVFKGRDEKTNEIVAIKMLSKNTINADDYLREGLMNEIKIMQALKGQNVVRLLDVLETSNNYYIVQEFCDGGDLQGLLKKKKQFSQNEAVKFFIDLLMGFMELVKKGIIHRDLKPANILINKGIYKIADFGFSKAIDNVQREMLTSAVGTPLYMSPQILKSQKYTSKSDIWSLGFIFYEVLCGVTPWTAKSIPELIKNIKTIPVSFPSHVYVDQGYQDLIRGCLKIDEKERLSWDEIFKHPCFGTTFQGYLDFAKQLEDKAKFLVNDLRVKVMRDKIDLEDLFHKYDYSGDKNLDIHEMTTLLHEIDSKLDRDEVEYIFNKIDEDGNGSVDLNEFKKWLEENNVRMSMKPQSQQYNKMQSFNSGETNQQQQHQSNLPFQQPPPPPPAQYQQPQYQQPQQPQQQFGQQQNFGSGSQGQYQQMNYQQQMSGSGSPYNQYPQQYGSQQGFQNYQGYPAQNQMKGSGNSPYPQQPYPQQPYPQQPYPQYPQMGGSNQQQYGYNQQQPSPTYIENQNRAQDTIKKLIMAIEKYNINVWELFKKYDKSDSSTLDVKEFGIMLRRIDSTLTDQDINQAFWLFDADKSGEITFLEFKDGIQFNIERSRNANRSQSYNYQGVPQQQQQWQQNKYG